MQKLNQNLYLFIADYLTLKEILNYSSNNKNIYNTFDDIFFKRLAVNMYSKDFWHKAYKRPKFYSNPLKNFKMELVRIENFQLMLDKSNIKRWTQKDFYDYWKINDKTIFNI